MPVFLLYLSLIQNVCQAAHTRAPRMCFCVSVCTHSGSPTNGSTRVALRPAAEA